jgi:hypothetical protein
MEEGMLRIIPFALILTCTAQLATAAGSFIQYADVNVSGGVFR